MDEPEGARQQHTEPVRIHPEQHFGQQIEEGVEQEDRNGEHGDEPDLVVLQGLMEHRDQPAQNDKVGHGVAHQNGPQEILRLFQIAVENCGGCPARAHLLANAQAAQREDPSLHAGQQERQPQAGCEHQPDYCLGAHLSPMTSTSNSRTRRSSVVCAVSFSPRKVADSPGFGTTSSRLAKRPPIVSAPATSPRGGYSRRKSSSRRVPLVRQRPGASFSMTKLSDSSSPRIVPIISSRISSIVTMPAVPPNSSSTMARPRCWRCKLFNSCNRFMVSGTNEGSSTASARSICGSSSNARALRMPTMVSSVWSYIGRRRCLYLRAATIISSMDKSSGMAAIRERGFMTSLAVRRSRLMICKMISFSDWASVPR